jgi:hypothetical protein
MTAMVRDALGDFRPQGESGAGARPGSIVPLLAGALGELVLFLTYLSLPITLGIGLIWFGISSWPDAATLARFNWHQAGVVCGKVLLPVFAGAGVLLLLLKPFLAKKAEAEVTVDLDLSSEDGMRRFLRELCAELKVEFPERVAVSCEPTVKVRRRAWGKLGRGKGLELVLGLPLLVGMELRGFGGLVSRELGFFSEGIWRTAERVLRSVHCWLARAVRAQDSWDRRIERAREAGVEGDFPFLAGCAEALVWLARRPLWLWLRASGMLCGKVLRRTEEQADERMIAFSGSQWLAPVVMRQRELEEGYAVARRQCEGALSMNDLPRDFPSLAVLRSNLLPEDHRSAAWQGLGCYRAGHPESLEQSLDERRKNVSEGREMGRSIGAVRASTLVEEYGRVSEEVSRAFFRARLGVGVIEESDTPLCLVPSTVAEAGAGSRVGECGASLFGRETCLQLPIHLSEEALEFLSVATPLLMENFIVEREKIRRQLIQYRESSRRALQAEMGGFAALQADIFLEIGIEIRPEEFGLKAANRAVTRKRLEEYAYYYGLAESETNEFFLMVRRVIQSTMSLVARNDFCSGDAKRSLAALQEMRSLVTILVSFGVMRSQMGGLRRHLSLLDGLFAAIQRMETPAATPSRCLARMRYEAEGIASVKRAMLGRLESVPCPFPDDEGAAVSVGDFLRQGAGLGEGVSSGEMEDDFAFASEQYRTGYAFNESLTDLYFRVVERVAFYVESVDWVVGRKVEKPKS